MEKCKNCGAELKPGVKFCTKCGTPIDGVSVAAEMTEPKNNNQTMEQIKQHSLSYFSWFKDTIVSPSKVNYDNKYFGLISLLLNAMVVAYGFYVLGHQIINSFMGALDNFDTLFSTGYANKVGIPNGFSLYIKLLLISAAYFGVFLLVGFICKKLLVNKETSLFNYATELASFSNSMLILEIIISIVLLMTVPVDINAYNGDSFGKALLFIVILITIMMTIWSVAYVASIVIDAGKMKIDKIYAAVITLILNSIVLVFVFYMIANGIASKYSSYGALLGAIR